MKGETRFSIRYHSDDASGITICEVRKNYHDFIDEAISPIRKHPQCLDPALFYIIINRYLKRNYLIKEGRNKVTEIIFKGMTHCNKNDVFDERTGRSIALSKAMNSYRKAKANALNELADRLSALSLIIRGSIKKGENL